VGGTTGTAPESAASLSSGGFCNRWPTADWQKDAVQAYLTTAAKVPAASYFNATGRGFPDISAQATGFTVVANLIPVPGVAGTSCASPTASGVMALLNDARLAAGKSSLGFLNPFIYQHADAFNDIVSGTGEGCGAAQHGFPAAKGWDPVTGVGTPNYAKLVTAVKALR
jgi:tripeptidyl-peptidase-1